MKRLSKDRNYLTAGSKFNANDILKILIFDEFPYLLTELIIVHIKNNKGLVLFASSGIF